jgi:hypothetical protein
MKLKDSSQLGHPTSLPFNYSDKGKWPPRPQMPSVNAHSQYPGIENAVEEDGWGHCLGFEGKGQEYQFFNRSWVVGIEE